MDAVCNPPCVANTPIALSSNQMPQYFPLSSGGSCGGTIPPYDPETFYAEGTVISYNGKYYAANADIPSGTAFQEGTSGQTWREVSLDASTIPPFSATKSYVQYEAVDYLGVLYTAVSALGPGPWDPMNFKPLATSGGVTIEVTDTQTIDMSGDGSAGDPVKGEVKVASALPNNIIVATGSGLFAQMDVTTTDSDGIVFTGDGSDEVPLTAEIQISADPDNILELLGDGLFVPPADGSTIVTADTETVDLSGDGSSGTPLSAAVKKSATDNNSLVLNADGLWTPTFAATDSPTIDFTGSGTVAVPLSAAVKISATADNQLTADGTGLYVPAPSAGAITVGDTNSVNLEGDGTAGTPLTAAVKRSATAGNAITENPDGLYVATVSPGLTEVTIEDTDAVNLSGNGTVGSPLTADVRLSPTPNNGIIKNSTGIWAPAGMPSGGSTGAVLRKSSATNYATEWALGVRTQTEGVTARTLVIGDQDLTLIFNAAGAKTVTVPTNASVALPVGTNIPVFNTGAADLTFVAAPGVTILKPANQSLQLTQYAAANLVKIGTNDWMLIGGMTPT